MAIRGTESKPLIKTSIPGPNGKKTVKKDDRFLVTTTKTAPVVAKTAKGCIMEDTDGNRFMDFAAGIGVMNCGHSHPHITKAIQDQAARLVHFAGTDYYYDLQSDYAERLAAKVPIPGRGAKVFYANSGTEANEASIKLAKKATGRHRFLAFYGGFHGRSQGSLGFTASKDVQQRGMFPGFPGVEHVHFPHPNNNIWGIDGYEEPQELSNRAIDNIEEVMNWKVPGEDLAACMWEPVQGEGGYVVPPKMFPKMLHDLMQEHGALLIADEVQTGFGRTGKWFASEHFGVKPDIMSLAKAMGNGVPIGASVCRSDLDFDHKGAHSNTYGGNLLACASAMATMDVLEKEELIKNSAAMGDIMAVRLEEMKERHNHITDARGLGLMRAISFDDPKLRNAVETECWKRGLLVLGCGPRGIRFIPPLNISEAQVHGGMDVMDAALKTCKA